MGRPNAANMRNVWHLRGGVLAAALGALALLPAGAFADSKNVSSFKLDSYHFWTKQQTPTIVTGATLKRGKPYVATVRGTISYYAAINYTSLQAPWKVLCGKAKRVPMFPGAGGSGPVGNDAEYIFAQPQTAACRSLPTRWENLQANAGGGWRHPEVLTLKGLKGPRPNHTYDYAVTGADKRLKFRLVDPDSRDNYGVFLIDVRTAVASDCAGSKYKAWDYGSQQQCVAAANDPGEVGPRPKTTVAGPIETGPVTRVLRGTDMPTATNRELPAGALRIDGFATVDNATRARAAAELTLLKLHGVRSTAISSFLGTDGVTWKSTALKLGSTTKAIATRSALATLHSKTQAPTGATAAFSADGAVAGGQLLTFRSADGQIAALELLAASGNYVYTLRVSGPAAALSQAAVEQLARMIVARG